MNKNILSFYFLVLALFIALTAPNLLSEGMFKDGLTYAAISRNLANGLGSFWKPHFTNTIFPFFTEHPPLALFLQSLFFRVFGDSIYIERIYSFLTFIISAVITYIIWKKVIKVNSFYSGWFVLFLLLTMPLILWAAPNNFLENTMMIFTSLSILFILKSYESKIIFNLGIAGLMISLGWLCKGFTACFPLSFPLWILIFIRKNHFSEFLINSLVLLLFATIPLCAICFFNASASENISIYLNHQVINSIKNVETVGNRFYILIRLIIEISIPLLILLFLYTIKQKKKLSQESIISKWSAAFFMLGLSGALPVMISMKQSSFYILASLPVFAISFSLLAAPVIKYLINIYLNYSKTKLRLLNMFAYTILGCSIIFSLSFLNQISNNKDKSLTNLKISSGSNFLAAKDEFREKIKDIKIISGKIPNSSTISISGIIGNDLYYQAYFSRLKNISLDTDPNNTHPYLLILKEEYPNKIDQYSRVILNTHCMDLLQKIE